MRFHSFLSIAGLAPAVPGSDDDAVDTRMLGHGEEKDLMKWVLR